MKAKNKLTGGCPAQCVNNGSHSDVNMNIVKALIMTGTFNLPPELLILLWQGRKTVGKIQEKQYKRDDFSIVPFYVGFLTVLYKSALSQQNKTAVYII